jgi:hypothetical protein
MSLAVLAAVPATQETRQELLSRHLLSLPLSETAIRFLHNKSRGERATFETVAETLTLTPRNFARAFEKRPEVGQEIIAFLKKFDLRLGMTSDEVSLYLSEGRVPTLSKISSVTVLNLPKRVEWALVTNGFRTINDVNEAAFRKIASQWNVGAESLRKARARFVMAGFPVGPNDVALFHRGEFDDLSTDVDVEAPITNETRVEQLGLSTYAVNVLKRKNVFAVGDVRTSSLKAFSGVLYVGDKRLAEIQYKFRSIGFPFPDDAEFICQTQLVTAPPEPALELESL